jgi:hypothetical protein
MNGPNLRDDPPGVAGEQPEHLSAELWVELRRRAEPAAYVQIE